MTILTIDLSVIFTVDLRNTLRFGHMKSSGITRQLRKSENFALRVS